ncbi:MAG: nucleoside deaminase [Candidatus Omnitrophica bacterium]|nr:nucleoside deaminase [Candidatus Omnitrophota bacterium]
MKSRGLEVTKLSRKIHEEYMREALKEARRSLEKGEVPVGAVVVWRGKVIGRAHNQMETLHDPTAHAEMIAITQAAETLSEGKTSHRGSLEGAAVYVTKEPCPMCAGAMVLAKAKAVFYGISDPKAGACGSLYNIAADDRLNHRLAVQGGILAEESKRFLQEFFRTLRKEKR